MTRSHRMRKIALTALAIPLFAACSNHSPTKTPSHTSPFYEYESSLSAQSAADGWQVACSSPEACPSTVGQLVVTAGSRVGVCTATLVANDVVVTNSHCFPDGFGAPEPLCSSNARIVFPASGAHPAESIECAAVLKKSDLINDAFDQPDYMVLKLKRATDRGAHPVSREGMREGEKLKIHKIDPLPRGGGTLTGETCEVLYGTVIRPQADEPENPIHVTKGCNVISGNSGSALTDERGRIRGLMFASKNLEDEPGRLPTLPSAEQKKITEIYRRLKIGLVTNASCIAHDFHGAGATHPDCDAMTLEEAGLSSSVDRERLAKALRDQITADLQAHPFDETLFGYDVVKDSSTPASDALRIAPACFKSAEAWQNRRKEASAAGRRWWIEIDIDDRLRLAFHVKSAELRTSVHLQGKFKRNGETPVSIMTSSDESGGFSVEHADWTVCKGPGDGDRP